MIKIDGHKHYDQKNSHVPFGQAILRGKIMTNPNGHNSNSA
jgi:hypothetical protein